MDSTRHLQVVSGLLRALAESNNPDDLCQLLATGVLKDFGVIATYLAVLDPDGRITMVGSWGYPAHRRDPKDRPSVWYPMAITETIRTGEVQVYETWDAYMERFPELGHRASPGKSFVCIPFTNGGARAGGLGLTFSSELTDYAQHRELWGILAQAGDLFVNRSWAGSIFKPNSIEAFQVPEGENAENLRHSFSDRDLQVMRLTIAGKTVTTISRQLRYSESTIKQTRMALYRKLGVRRAEDLGLAAKALGLFDE